jgi:G3E family GTPase
LNNLLTNNHGLKIAVVVNDLAAVNVDAKLIAKGNLTVTKFEFSWSNYLFADVI